VAQDERELIELERIDGALHHDHVPPHVPVLGRHAMGSDHLAPLAGILQRLDQGAHRRAPRFDHARRDVRACREAEQNLDDLMRGTHPALAARCL